MQIAYPFVTGSRSEDRPGGRSLLVIAHPGHELRLFGWLNEVRPDVLVLTDGSGHGGRPRIENSRRVLLATGARATALFGEYTDRQIYRGLLSADMSIFTQMALTLAAVLQRGNYGAVVADPFEGYNPTHDLCRVLVNAAVQFTSGTHGGRLLNYDYALTEMSDFRACESLTAMRLSPQMRLRKRAAAAEYVELTGEVKSAVQREGALAYDQEVLREITADRLAIRSLERPPFYETYGEKQCAAGRYATVIRYSQHFVPIAKGIVEVFRSMAQLPVIRTASSARSAF
jgi:hypothetical protein